MELPSWMRMPMRASEVEPEPMPAAWRWMPMRAARYGSEARGLIAVVKHFFATDAAAEARAKPEDFGHGAA